jgi:miniconductance mechanosensitive channel
MLEFVKNYLLHLKIDGIISNYLSIAISIIFVVLSLFIINFVSKKILLQIMKVIVSKSRTKWDDVLFENKVFEKIANIIPALFVLGFAYLFPGQVKIIQKITYCYIVFIIILVLNALINSFLTIFKSHEHLKNKPLKGYFDFIKIIFASLGVIIIVSIIIEKSPVALLSGIGALTAILLLIFKDALLGLVGSVQIAAKNIVQNGDWIEIPKYNIEGEVLDISLTIIQIKNADNTISNIPTYSLVSEPFKNSRMLATSGGRRIKRSLFIDMKSIRFCDEKMLENIGFFFDFKKYAETKSIEKADFFNDNKITNITIFRLYIEHFLKNNTFINQDLNLVVRLLQPSENGLPVEIYAFCKEIDWVNFESIQSGILEKLITVMPEFGLSIYQHPASTPV